MTLARLALRSLRFYWRTGIVVAIGVAIASAVITASLIVGDSVTGSLRDRALSRLGSVQYALMAPREFRDSLAKDVQKAPALAGQFATVQSVLVLHGSARNPVSDATLPGVTVLGVHDSFWSLFPGTKLHLQGRQAGVSASLAQDLRLKVGDGLLLRVDRPGSIVGDDFFARRSPSDTQVAFRVQIARILPEEGAGGFALNASSDQPRNLFLSRGWISNILGKPGRSNTLLAAGKPGAPADPVAVDHRLQQVMDSVCTLADQGLRFVPNPGTGAVAFQSRSIVLTDPQVEAVKTWALKHGSTPVRVSAYLASEISDDRTGGNVSYSMLAGIDPGLKLHFEEGGGEALSGNDAWINRWCADDLHARVGDRIHLSYMVSSWDGVYRTASADFVVRGIIAMDNQSTNPGFIPSLEGITEAGRIDEWNAPFPVDHRRITPRDEEYWNKYHATPRVFVAPAAAYDIWSSSSAGCHAGWVTSVIIPKVSAKAPFALPLSADRTGMVFLPVRRQALEEAKGATDFAGLLLSMSFFMVASAIGMAGMLLRLMVERRAREAGLMLAVGLTTSIAARVMMVEGMILCMVGVLMGLPLGILYAWGIVHGLDNWWIGAIGTAVLWLHLRSESLILGPLMSLIVGAGAVLWATSAYRTVGVMQLITGWQFTASQPPVRSIRLATILLVALTGSAVALVAFSITTGRPDPGVSCFVAGAALLIASLAGGYLILCRSLTSNAMLGFRRLVMVSAAASRGRSLLLMGLVASASFMIVSVAANTRDLGRTNTDRKDSGAGGFALQATSSIPVRYDFGSPTGRRALGFWPQDEPLFRGVQVMPFLQSPGEDISCLNLNRPTAPRILGVPQKMIDRGGFTILTQQARIPSNPWTLLTRSVGPHAPIPAFGDADSVTWTIASGLGRRYRVFDSSGAPADLIFKGLLSRSIFASELLVSQDQFRRLYPDVASPRYFLISTPPGQEQKVAEALRRNMGGMGLEVKTTREVLASYGAVQNTYLSMFLALGGLGVLLGVIGMVTVVLRNALDRRGEWALMLACGFSQRDLRRMLILETSGLLTAGVISGSIAALIGTAPQLTLVESAVSWPEVGGILSAVLALGLVCSAVAARAAVAGNLLEDLQARG